VWHGRCFFFHEAASAGAAICETVEDGFHNILFLQDFHDKMFCAGLTEENFFLLINLYCNCSTRIFMNRCRAVGVWVRGGRELVIFCSDFCVMSEIHKTNVMVMYQDHQMGGQCLVL
jgi:hypothetical protein